MPAIVTLIFVAHLIPVPGNWMYSVTPAPLVLLVALTVNSATVVLSSCKVTVLCARLGSLLI